MGVLADLAGSFGLGLVTPLTALCVLPLYPGFLAYLSKQSDSDRSVGVLGLLVAVGVVGFMVAFGLVFTTLLEVSLTNAIEVVSPVAFGLLGAASLLLLADVEFGRFLRSVEPPTSRHPTLSALGYGAFFGAIVLPCNPGFIGVFFARAFLFTEPVSSMLNFLAFGLGMAAPLLALALASDRWSTRLIRVLTRHSSVVNRATGAVMLAVSAYYLLVVFDVFGLGLSLSLSLPI